MRTDDSLQANLALLFERRVAADPKATAIVGKSGVLEYGELNGLANRLARYLSKRGVEKGNLVCIELGKAPETYALALGCLKLGAPFIFLDPLGPADRGLRMVERCQPVLVIGPRPGPGKRLVVENSDEIVALSQGYGDDNLAETKQVMGDDPAYIMFTSGSTGEPKGAINTHKGAVNLVEWSRRAFAISPGDCLTNVNPLYFDNSVFDIWCSLCNGASLAIVETREVATPVEILRQIANSEATIFFAVPTLFIYLNRLQLLTPNLVPNIRLFIFGGEGYPAPILSSFFDAFYPQAKFVNVYGPTECSCICSSYSVSPEDLDMAGDGLLPLGRLNPGIFSRILDTDGRPTRPGETGELWLGGIGVGLGYVNESSMTAEAFHTDPLKQLNGEIFYKTGDLVEECPETGLLSFKGRADNQIKIRGYRVELEEVDHAVAAFENITRAVTVVHGDDNNILGIVTAYVTDTQIDEDALEENCRRKLPPYMVPNRFLRLDEMPTNSNGKIDRRAIEGIVEASLH